MKTLDLIDGTAVEVAEYWEQEADSPVPTVVTITVDIEEDAVEFAFETPEYEGNVILCVPMERLRRLLRAAQ
jgi:hypothetical protein